MGVGKKKENNNN